MKLIVRIEDIKLVNMVQGTYIKTKEPYKYMIVLLPKDSKIEKHGDNLIIEVEDYFYKRKRLYRFDKNHIDRFKV